MRSFLTRPSVAALARGAGLAWALVGAAVVVHGAGVFRFREAWGLAAISVAAGGGIVWALRRAREAGPVAATLCGMVLAMAAVVPLDLVTERLVAAWVVGAGMTLVGGGALVATSRAPGSPG